MKPQEGSDKVIFQRGPWQLHELNMEYENGQILPKLYLEWPNSVMIFAIEKNDVILIREFCRAMNRHEIFAPKGKIDPNEPVDIAAQRELQEEAGLKAKNLVKMTTLSVYPNHLQGETSIFLARDLTKDKLPHDDNEEIEVLRVPVKDMTKMIESGKITEARTIAGWFLVQNYLANENNQLER